MLIVSQDREGIINFNNVIALTIEQHEEYHPDKKYLIEAEISADEHIECGLYKTEERAKEVLQEIVKEYSSYLELKGGPAILQGQMDIQPNIFNIPKVYEMPEE